MARRIVAAECEIHGDDGTSKSTSGIRAAAHGARSGALRAANGLETLYSEGSTVPVAPSRAILVRQNAARTASGG